MTAFAGCSESADELCERNLVKSPLVERISEYTSTHVRRARSQGEEPMAASAGRINVSLQLLSSAMLMPLMLIAGSSGECAGSEPAIAVLLAASRGVDPAQAGLLATGYAGERKTARRVGATWSSSRSLVSPRAIAHLSRPGRRRRRPCSEPSFWLTFNPSTRMRKTLC